MISPWEFRFLLHFQDNLSLIAAYLKLFFINKANQSIGISLSITLSRLVVDTPEENSVAVFSYVHCSLDCKYSKKKLQNKVGIIGELVTISMSVHIIFKTRKQTHERN